MVSLGIGELTLSGPHFLALLLIGCLSSILWVLVDGILGSDPDSTNLSDLIDLLHFITPEHRRKNPISSRVIPLLPLLSSSFLELKNQQKILKSPMQFERCNYRVRKMDRKDAIVNSYIHLARVCLK